MVPSDIVVEPPDGALIRNWVSGSEGERGEEEKLVVNEKEKR